MEHEVYSDDLVVAGDLENSKSSKLWQALDDFEEGHEQQS